MTATPWRWLSKHIDKLIADDRKRVNTESLVLAASGKEQQPRTAKGAPGTRKAAKQAAAAAAAAAGNHHPAAPGLTTSPKGGKGKGKGKDGKGKGKNAANGYDSGAESDGTGRKKTSDFQGKPVAEVPKDKRCCLHYLWVRKDGPSLCDAYNKGIACWKGPHLKRGTPEMLATNLYARMKSEHGKPNCPADGPPKKPAAPAAPAAAAGENPN